ncbi:spore protease YyaC [Serpentinicella sp. ANB-PHB4]|uniref:spore protease YyaC n=1 Tax=Serpentinicella sp. ANB-PHB4 TaxID=3074076 RepID=UPI0028646A6A|nr:spore protease YyaC [Serpentinicella sp. ANB-PHB4]MDR5658894.1 spore protease YyaC [Serpentinicella sp. ANB-PHB4]
MSLSPDVVKKSVNIDSTKAYFDFSSMLTDYIKNYYTNQYEDIIFLCIGSDRSTGDSLGPLIGYKLEKHLSQYTHIKILGTLDRPVHAKNLEETIQHIYSSYNNPFVIAIDACLGKMDRVGCVTVNHGPLKPGTGVNKELPSVGDIHITGIVNIGGYMQYMVLQSTRLNLVMKMADTISDAIKFTLWDLNKKMFFSRYIN